MRRSSLRQRAPASMHGLLVGLVIGSAVPAAAQVDASRADSLFGASQWEAAAAAYATLCKQDPKDGRIWFQLGFARHQAGDPAGAVEALTKAEALEFAPQRVRYRLALAEAETGDTQSALRWLRSAVDAGFTHLGVLRTDAGLAALRDTPGFAAVIQAAEAAHVCSREPCRQFDFWVGSWKVSNASGQRVGTNHIRRVENGCALQENWTSARGGTGTSINFFHPGRARWVQTWFDGSGGIIDLEGELRDGAMHMHGTHYAADGTFELIRGTWTPLADGRVRQLFEQSRDQGSTWYVWFDGYYERMDSDAPASDGMRGGRR